MIAPVKTLRKKDIEWLAAHKCKHSHTYLAHYQCWITEQPQDCPFVEKVGYFDIETTDLTANYGYMQSYAIKVGGEDTILGRHLTPKEVKSFKFDKDLIQECSDDLRKFHRIIVYYGTDYRFDLPFVRTRSLKYGVDFPLYKDVFTQDAYSVVKAKLRLAKNSLWSACSFLEIPSKGHWLTADVRMRSFTGDLKSLEYIWTHNLEDVYSLEALWEKLDLYVTKGRRSL